MLLEQITTDYEDDDNQQPAPKGMVETETGRMITKAKAAKDEKSFVDAMQAQWKSRPEVIARLKAAKLKAMKKKK
ncbi:hypothetical protein EBU24_01220 [bacterium]|nr:hypothetical protein [bacterium]